MAFNLAICPWIHCARYDGEIWVENFVEQKHLSFEEENALDEQARRDLINERNHLQHLPLVNCTTQYGLSCFEGLKAFPQVDGSLKLFRPDRNCVRMDSSMKGLRMPPLRKNLLLNAITETVRRNRKIGFTPAYNPKWEDDFWLSGEAVYIRSFTYTEPGIGINLAKKPWVVTVCTTVSAFFTPGKNNAVTTRRIRATPYGIGYIKTSANYVCSILARAEAIDEGYMEAIFLDSLTRENIEEGSACNFFALFPGKRLVTPALGDTILPGVTRESVITLARNRGMDVHEEILPVKKVLDEALECFLTGTAAGITPLGSLTHQNRIREFSSLEDDSVSIGLLKELKSIQYGATKDPFGWMFEVRT